MRTSNDKKEEKENVKQQRGKESDIGKKRTVDNETGWLAVKDDNSWEKCGQASRSTDRLDKNITHPPETSELEGLDTYETELSLTIAEA